MATVLILGGLGLDATRHLVTHLVASSPDSDSLEPRPRPALVRIVDKALAIPQADAYTTYVDSDTRNALRNGVQQGTVELVQGNLLQDATRDKAFALPDQHGGPAKGFDWVFDFTGETDFSTPEIVRAPPSLLLRESSP